MPSPPLAPGSDAIDVAHLTRVTLGERELAREVLGMFLEQSGNLMMRLAHGAGVGADVAHTLKGAAKAIGAFAVADAAEDVEHSLRSGHAARRQIASLQDALDTARTEIQGLLLKH